MKRRRTIPSLTLARCSESMMLRPRIIARSQLSLALFGLTLGLFLVEMTTRALVICNHSLEPMVPAAIGRFDERFGWSLRPYASASSRRSGQKINYRINSKGLRDTEMNYEKPRGIFRIVLLGDSNTFGHGVPVEKHFSTLLERRFPNVEVVNMGVGGYGVDQELLYLQQEGFRYNPDLVLAYVPHYADQRHMHSNRFGRDKPRFVLNGEQLTLTNYPVPYNLPLPRALLPIHSWCVSQSKLCELLHVRGAAFIKDSSHVLSNIRQASTEGPSSLSITRPESDTRELGARIVTEIGDECRKRAVSFALVTRIGSLHEALARNGHKSLEVSRALASDKFKIPNDNHDNEAANDVLASEIGRFLQTSNLLPPEHWHIPD